MQIYTKIVLTHYKKMFKFDNTECWTLCWETNCHPVLAEGSTISMSLIISLVIFSKLNNMHGQQSNNPLQGICPRDTLSHVGQKTSSGYSSHSFQPQTHTHTDTHTQTHIQIWNSLIIHQYGFHKLNIYTIKSTHVNLDYLKTEC